ncbi:UNVERIFIED_ORG: hypothetical protein ABIC62_002431 [Burkholderia sp. 1595]|uniref:Uncharacterized protein n=1 Tax=Paraburkholderia terricola TaxID=169427 RepID=A0ABU1LSM1_9BURK|nr:hypothetical protein [Paraburkholderia terricola]
MKALPVSAFAGVVAMIDAAASSVTIEAARAAKDRRLKATRDAKRKPAKRRAATGRV